jgi:hypothetical protein
MRALVEKRGNQATSYKFIVASIGVFVVCILCLTVLIYDHEYNILDGLRTLGRQKDLAANEARYRQILSTISSTTNDIMLKEKVINSLRILGGSYVGCISGTLDRIYGTNRSFNEVLLDYANTFSATDGWEQKIDGRVYSIETAAVYLQEAGPSTEDYQAECKNYQTCYKVRLYYADPAVLRCSG